ncbi:MAG: VWA domain-containing protein [Opitutaceae bacterium]|nr:VWA domain-containing protein [Opitutaceae bacterium]
MSVTTRRRETEVFSLAFLDCICCGFGAMILVFILTVSQKRTVDKAIVDDLRDRAKAAARTISTTEQDLDRLAKVLAAAQLDLQDVNAKNNVDELKLSARQRELLLMLQQTGAMKDALNTLLGEKKNLPTEDHAPIPIPNVDRRQYLTGVRLQGDFIVFIVRASGSMLDDTIDLALSRLDDSDAKKREAPKWQRVVHSLEWMIASLGPSTHFQILFFNEETVPILPDRAEEWFSNTDKKTLGDIVKRLHEIVPKGGANLEKAFAAVRYLPRLPDSIVLFTDGLPTKSDSLPFDGDVGEEQRIRFFEIAVKQLPPRIPVSTILFPMNGDPAGPAEYWELANFTRGAMVSPAKSWPDT